MRSSRGDRVFETKATSLDVAKRAGVSQSAVSRVYTKGASVSAKTAEKVRAAATELGYRPNVLARSLITGKSRMIGLVVAYLDNYFYPDVLEKLSKRLQEEGYHVLIFMASQTAGNIDDVLQEILDYQVDGIVMASVAMSSDLAARCRAAGVPVVLFNRTQDDDGLSSIASNNFAGGRKIAEHLLTLNPDRIGYIAGWEGASTQRDREAGFIAGIGQAPDLREVGDFHMERAQAAARSMFDRDDPPDALFVANDHMAFAALDVMRSELGIDVPGEVVVAGFDDAAPSAWPAYDLTTVRQRANAMVEETVAALMVTIENPDAPPRRVEIDGPLIVRRSTQKEAP
ncbi:MAG: LacI family DNA-binding transcriptional regulator [Pseudomonadota bacterium]